MTERTKRFDAVLIGGGIMSATLGVLLRQVEPDWSLLAVERLDDVGFESSGPWNNAGTGHAALCELNYTPQRSDGSIDTVKAKTVNEQFHVSRQLWSSLVQRGAIPDPSAFVNSVPHMSFVRGAADIAFLRRRYDALRIDPLFASVCLSEDRAEIADWLPLMMKERPERGAVAVTRSEEGTDVDWGALTRLMFRHLAVNGVDVRTGQEVQGLERDGAKGWTVRIRSRHDRTESVAHAPFVFVGAGGASLRLLQSAGIEEIRGYGGFPVGGRFLRCDLPDIVSAHQAKVYGKSTAAAPPMTMPHLDRRISGGKPSLLFGPYAGFSPRFLKEGSRLDLMRSVRPDNLLTLLTVAKDEFPLTMYLIRQLLQSSGERIDIMRDFVPTANAAQWTLQAAGQRVQTMKRTARKRGALEFGTEMIASRDRSIAGILGASPGASTAASIVLDVLETCFPNAFPGWEDRIREIIPSIGVVLGEDPSMLDEVRAWTSRTLQLTV